MHALIAIASFRRPDDLRVLLDSLLVSAAESQHTMDILVVDNDPSGSAEPTVRAFGDDVRYVLEPQPGIAEARNRSLDDFAGDAGYDAIVFVDDDEYVSASWWDVLATAAVNTTAGVVTGPVTSIFPDATPDWIRRGEFMQRAGHRDRERLTAAATNNTLLKRSDWERAGSPRFDRSFSSTGGSDARLFADLLAAGVTIEFCLAAEVFEPVPRDRMTQRWVARRAFRNGVVLARIGVTKRSALLTFAHGGFLAVTGFALALVDLVRVRGLHAQSFNRTLHGLGVMSSFFGARVHEYKRG
ncbi:glycosyltransferase [Plantibacter sp. CFBP 8798]|uniref:glycosyltransferase family 2 protein n=1 Tax=Plantibacter sp. CFBP 8798 TaxID=2775268 RepID=UPI0017838E32|nr:glycosyltransferase [Plantibacter sp. CFBP 8798]MBD8467494.1 glycosyltransferase [Plantibacter sp. CFBP 8798]